jgi:uncharacterized membrane protein
MERYNTAPKSRTEVLSYILKRANNTIEEQRELIKSLRIEIARLNGRLDATNSKDEVTTTSKANNICIQDTDGKFLNSKVDMCCTKCMAYERTIRAIRKLLEGLGERSVLTHSISNN